MSQLVVYLIALSFVAAPVSGPSPPNTNAKIKAIFLYNFTQYIDWPAAYKKDDFKIAILGASVMTPELQKLAKLKKVGSQRMVVKQYASLNELQKCHILYVPAKQSAQIDKAIQKVKGWSTLLITDHPASGKKSGINFIVEQNKQKFELNKTVLTKKKLVVSSSLLKLAKTVY